MRARVAARERRRGEHDVAERLGEDAAEPEHHARPELRIAHQAGDQLAPSAHHLGDQQRDARRRRAARAPSSSAAARAHGGGVGEAEPHEIALGLVGDRVAAQLQHDREAESPRPPAGRRPRRAPALARDGHAVARDELLRLVLGERPPGRVAGGLAIPAAGRGVNAGRSSGQRERYQPSVPGPPLKGPTTSLVIHPP